MSYLNSKRTVCEEWRVLRFEPGTTPLDRSPVEALGSGLSGRSSKPGPRGSYNSGWQDFLICENSLKEKLMNKNIKLGEVLNVYAIELINTMEVIFTYPQ